MLLIVYRYSIQDLSFYSLMSTTSFLNLPSFVAKNLTLATAALFLVCALLGCLTHDYYSAGIWASLGTCMSLAQLAKQYSKPLLSWIAGAALLLALTLIVMQFRADQVAGRARRAQQAKVRQEIAVRQFTPIHAASQN